MTTKSIRVSEELFEQAEAEAQMMSRSAAQQLEHWARVGLRLEASGMTISQLKDLLRGELDTGLRLRVSVRQAIQYIAGSLGQTTHDRALRRAVSELLGKHFQMQYGDLPKLELTKRQQLAHEIREAEMSELRQP